MELPSHKLVLNLDAGLFGTVKKMNLTAYKTLVSCSSNQLHVRSRVVWIKPLTSEKRSFYCFSRSSLTLLWKYGIPFQSNQVVRIDYFSWKAPTMIT